MGRHPVLFLITLFIFVSIMFIAKTCLYISFTLFKPFFKTETVPKNEVWIGKKRYTDYEWSGPMNGGEKIYPVLYEHISKFQTGVIVAESEITVYRVRLKVRAEMTITDISELKARSNTQQLKDWTTEILLRNSLYREIESSNELYNISVKDSNKANTEVSPFDCLKSLDVDKNRLLAKALIDLNHKFDGVETLSIDYTVISSVEDFKDLIIKPATKTQKKKWVKAETISL